jgi:20S proteasome alpha/beta subunit
LGSGSAYAEYLLGKLYREDMTVHQAATLAVYVVEEVKKIDPGCGGTTQLVTMEGGKLKRWSTDEVAALVADITAREKGFIDGWWQAVKQGTSATMTR